MEARCLDRQRVEEIVRIARDWPIAELRVREGDLEVRIVKSPASASITPVSHEVAQAEPVPTEREPLVVIRADKVGFFHRGRGPGTDPLVEVGDYVHEGQAVATLEALRKLTDVTAPCCGTILRLLVEDGSAVDYGQPLMELRPREEAGGDGNG